ncbi:MAG: transporter, partial [Aquificota bacterium]
PLESSSSATLPEGSWLLYTKLDSVRWRKYSFSDFPDQKDRSDFWMLGIGYGLRSWLSLYVFAPYNVKKELRDGGERSFTSRGFADPSIMAVLGFKYDGGLRLIPRRESLEDMMDWHFTLYGGVSLPTGDANRKGYMGEFAPDMASGFGKPTITAGFTATKQMVNLPELTFVFDASYLKFFEHRYNTGDRYRFGDEFRANTALVYRVFRSQEKSLRLDLLTELNYLHLQKDRENGISVEDSGGDVVYGVFGGRLYYRRASLGAGVKLPLWKDLNQQSQQQGAEGKEKYRLIITLSLIF